MRATAASRFAFFPVGVCWGEPWFFNHASPSLQKMLTISWRRMKNHFFLNLFDFTPTSSKFKRVELYCSVGGIEHNVQHPKSSISTPSPSYGCVCEFYNNCYFWKAASQCFFFHHILSIEFVDEEKKKTLESLPNSIKE